MPKGIQGRVYVNLICNYCGKQFTVPVEQRSQKHCSRECYWNSLIKKVSIHLSEAELGYIAGIIDGEGSICFNKRKYTLTPVVYISNSSESLINWLEHKIPIRVYLGDHEDRRKPTYKKMYSLQVFGVKVLKDFLTMLEPYLVIKKEQARLALTYIEERLNTGHRLSEEKEAYYHQQMKELNNPTRQLSMKVDFPRESAISLGIMRNSA